MKKILYIHIFFMTITFSITCMNNNTTLVIPDNGLISPFSPYHGTRYDIPAVVPGAYSQAHNRKERREAQRKQGVQQKAKQVTIADEAERVSQQIDEKIIGIGNDGNCCSNFVDRMVSRGVVYWSINSFCSEAIIIRTLQQIDEYIQESPYQGSIIKPLGDTNGVFYRLVARLIEYKKEQGITGSTIDGFLDESRLFPQLSNSLAQYIGKQLSGRLFTPVYREHSGLSPKSTSVQAYFRQDETYSIDSSLCAYKRMNPEIHAIVLTGNQYQIDHSSVMISADNKYIKAMDMFTTIIWDMQTGERCDDIIERSIVWVKKEVYEKNNNQINTIQFNGDEQYHVSLCNTNSLFVRNYCVEETKQPALYLYKRPTWISSLCQTIFYKNRDNNNELNALLHSEMVQKKLKGFPQKNLIHAIQKAKEENEREKMCVF